MWLILPEGVTPYYHILCPVAPHISSHCYKASSELYCHIPLIIFLCDDHGTTLQLAKEMNGAHTTDSVVSLKRWDSPANYGPLEACDLGLGARVQVLHAESSWLFSGFPECSILWGTDSGDSGRSPLGQCLDVWRAISRWPPVTEGIHCDQLYLSPHAPCSWYCWFLRGGSFLSARQKLY